MKLTDEDIREILRLIDESDVAELRIETEEFALYVRRGSGDAGPATPQRPRGVSASPRPASVVDTPETDGAGTITSPMLGTFYRAQEPGAEPFVEVGSEVEADTIVCIIEVMKMMNSIPAGVAGTIVEVFAENAEVVESGEPLFRVQAPA